MQPLPRFELETVQERLYRGYCRDIEEYLQYAGWYLEKKEEIYALIGNFELLDKNEKKRILKYYDDFYTVISNERALQSEFMSSCLKKN